MCKRTFSDVGGDLCNRLGVLQNYNYERLRLWLDSVMLILTVSSDSTWENKALVYLIKCKQS